jgi:acetyltransferase-like isoleucine patch superfamily enzyme/O-antigen/teichoic acid export membrane protein
MTDAQVGLDVRPVTGAGRQTPPRRWSPRVAFSAVWGRHQDLLSNASCLLATTGVTSGLGFAFWTFAARVFSQQAVGYGSAAVSAMSLLGTVGVFGLGTVLIGELPRRSPGAGLVSAALLASGLGALLLGVGFAVVAPLVSRRFGDIMGTPAEAALFAAGVVLTAVTAVFDQATIGLLRGGVQLARNLVFAVAKMLALPAAAIILHDQFGLGITLSWVGGMAVSLASAAIWLRVRGSPVLARPDWGVLRGLGRTAMAHNWLNLAIAVPVTLIPVLVTVVVSPSANAAFYIAWMLTSFLYSVPVALSTVLFAVASADPQIIARKLRFALWVSLLIGLPGMLALCFGAHLALSMFGPGYARAAAFPLWLLSLGYVPALPKTYYVAVCRAAGKVSRAAAILTTFAAVEVTAAAVGGSLGGLRGLSFAILGVSVVEALATAPAVLRTAIGHGRHRRAGAPTPDNSGDSARGARPGELPPGPARTEPRKRDRQEAGIAALVSLALSAAPTVPVPVVAAGPQRVPDTPAGEGVFRIHRSPAPPDLDFADLRGRHLAARRGRGSLAADRDTGQVWKMRTIGSTNKEFLGGLAKLRSVVQRDGLSAVGRYVIQKGHGYLRARLSGADRFGKRPLILGRVRFQIRGKAVFGDRFMADGQVVTVSIAVSSNASLSIGDGVYMNAGASIEVWHDVRIGSNVLMAPFASVIDDDRHLVEPGASLYKGPTIVGNNVWLGRNVAVLPGVTVGDGSVIGGNSVVTKDIPPNSFAAGSPARVIRKLEIPDGWSRR